MLCRVTSESFSLPATIGKKLHNVVLSVRVLEQDRIFLGATLCVCRVTSESFYLPATVGKKLHKVVLSEHILEREGIFCRGNP